MTLTRPDSSLPTLRDVLDRVHKRMVLAAVLLAAISCTIAGAMVIRDYEVRNLQLTASSIAYTVEPALVFGDLGTAGDGISEVVDASVVSKVVLTDEHGDELGKWDFESNGWTGFASELADPIFWPTPLEASISHSGNKLGTVYVYGRSAMVLTYLAVGLAFALTCTALALLTTRTLSRRLQGDVIGPLEQIAETAHAVRHQRTFSKRVPVSGIEEIDRFSQDFNALIGELQERHEVVMLENRKLTKKATIDPLTGLGNRASFETCLEEAIAHDPHRKSGVTVAFLDLDRFKPINDVFGHDAGDEVLRKIGGFLKRMDTPNFRAFRIGGDEFAIVIKRCADRHAVDRMVGSLETSFQYGAELPCGSRVPISISAGAAVFPKNGTTASQLLKHADTEMYKHKRRRSASSERHRRYA